MSLIGKLRILVFIWIYSTFCNIGDNWKLSFLINFSKLFFSGKKVFLTTTNGYLILDFFWKLKFYRLCTKATWKFECPALTQGLFIDFQVSYRLFCCLLSRFDEYKALYMHPQDYKVALEFCFFLWYRASKISVSEKIWQNHENWLWGLCDNIW